MPYCATCRTEYRDGHDTCTDCGSVLVAGPMPSRLVEQESRRVEQETWCVLVKAMRRERAEIVKGMLESQDIPCEIISKALSEMPVPAMGFSSYFECWVPRGDEETARALMTQAEGVSPCRRCGHLSDPEAAACEYCGEGTSLDPGMDG